MIDVEKLAREVGMHRLGLSPDVFRITNRHAATGNYVCSPITMRDLSRFSALVLEAAAQECEKASYPYDDDIKFAFEKCADAIEAMKPKE